METQIIKSKLEELPEDLKREVYDFVEFLLQKHGAAKVKKGKFKFDWEGGLSNLKKNILPWNFNIKHWSGGNVSHRY